MAYRERIIVALCYVFYVTIQNVFFYQDHPQLSCNEYVMLMLMSALCLQWIIRVITSSAKMVVAAFPLPLGRAALALMITLEPSANVSLLILSRGTEPSQMPIQ